MRILNENSIMPVGKYKGYIIDCIPANYLHWFYYNVDKNEKTNPVHNFIADNMVKIEEKIKANKFKLREELK